MALLDSGQVSMSRIFIRVYSPSLVVTEPNMTLAQLRLSIQETSNGGMVKRTAMYTEVLDVMHRLDNLHVWPEEMRTHYRLGASENGADSPKLISPEDEEKPMHEVFNAVMEDLVVVPVMCLDKNGHLSGHVAAV